MKKILLPFLLFFCLLTKAQQFSIKWSDKFKLTSGIFANNVYSHSLPSGNGTIISLFQKIQTFGSGDYLIAKFNDKPEIEKQVELNFKEGGREGLIDMVKLRKNFYIIKYRFSSKETAEILVSRINPETLIIEGTEKRIGTIDDSDSQPKGLGSRGYFSLDVGLSYSTDSSKFVIIYEPDQKRKDAKKAQVMVINDDLQMVYSKSYEWNDPSNKVSIRNFNVDNQGRVFMFCNVYEKDFEIALLRSDGDKVPPYTSHMVIFDNKGAAASSVNTNGKFIHNASLAYNADGKSTILIGVYKEKNNSRLAGVFKADINPGQANKTVSNIVYTAYPQDLLNKTDKDDQGKNSGKNPGLDNNFNTNYVISVSDGVNHMISEYFDIDTKGVNNEFVKFTKGDFIITTFLQNGKIEFQRIPRNQQTLNAVSSTNIAHSGSFTPDYIKDKLILFYNDDEENIYKDLNEAPEKFSQEKKSALVVAALSHEGKLINRKMAYSHSGLDGYVTNLRFTEIKENTYLVFANKSGNMKHGMMIGLLTVK